MSPSDGDGRESTISLSEASRIAGVSASTLKRWASDGLIPVAEIGRASCRERV